MQVAGNPRLRLEVGPAVVTVEPDGGQLGDGQAEAMRLGDQLDADLEPRVGLDADSADEFLRIRLEGVGGIVGADACQQVQRSSGCCGHATLEPWPADLL